MNTEENKKNETLREITEKCIEQFPEDFTKSRMCIIHNEFKRGFKFMKKYPKTVTIFGSARLAEDTKAYKNAEMLAGSLTKAGYTIVTGGGNGIMGAANKGANLAGGDSLGINIELPFEQQINKYVTDSVTFHHFFSRKVTLSYAAEAYIYCQGGFGTMDEMFEILTLKQTGKIPSVPIILFGSDFWNPIVECFKETLLKPGQETINPQDLDLFIVTDDIDEVVTIIDSAPEREEISPVHHLHDKDK